MINSTEDRSGSTGIVAKIVGTKNEEKIPRYSSYCPDKFPWIEKIFKDYKITDPKLMMIYLNFAIAQVRQNEGV